MAPPAPTTTTRAPSSEIPYFAPLLPAGSATRLAFSDPSAHTSELNLYFFAVAAPAPPGASAATLHSSGAPCGDTFAR